MPRNLAMTLITVVSADSPLGLAIVTEASLRRLRIRAVVSNPASFPATRLPTELVRGDLLDMTCPEHLISNGEVLVVPLGSNESNNVDFASDLHVAMVLSSASESLRSKTTQIVVAGRAPRTEDAAFGGNLGHQRFEHGARALAEHAAVAMYAAHMKFPWIYVSPDGSLDTSITDDESTRRCSANNRRLSAAAAPGVNVRYIDDVVDVVERCALDAHRSAETVVKECEAREVYPLGDIATRQLA